MASIIPSSWVDRARQGPVKATDGFHYATFGGRFPARRRQARGRYPQIILVLPKLDIVAVMTGALKDGYVPTTDLIDGLAGAIKSDASLTPDTAPIFARRIDLKSSRGAGFSGGDNARIGETHIG